MSSARVSAYLLDLGGVLLEIDFQRTVMAFKSLIPHLDPNNLYGTNQPEQIFTEYELGNVKESQVITAMERKYGVTITPDQFANAWNQVILDFFPNAFSEVKRLRETAPVYIFSNINALHADRVQSVYEATGRQDQFQDNFDGVFYSHQEHFRKPHPENFAEVCKRIDCQPKEVVFVDDLATNISGALTAGLQAHHFDRGKHPDLLKFLSTR